jgi:regulatory subunit for Cdc7p protein kinase
LELKPRSTQVSLHQHAQVGAANERGSPTEIRDRKRTAAAGPIVGLQVRDPDLEFRSWQEQWRQIMVSSVVYFDNVDQASIEKVKGHIRLVGAKIQPFFDRAVTVVVTRRPTDVDYPTNDVICKARLQEMKVWTFDKLIRFLTNLTGVAPLKPGESHSNLSHFLRKEKLIGPTDRDLDVPVDKFHAFKGPYILVWDPNHILRPTIKKEYAIAPSDAEGDWPQFRVTPIGRCPFVYEPHPDKVLKERKRRRVEEPQPVKKLIVETHHQPPGYVVNVSNSQTAGAVRLAGASMTSRFYELAASGINRSNMTSAVRSAARSGDPNGAGGANGLAAPVSQVPSRELMNLQRKVLCKPVAPDSAPKIDQLAVPVKEPKRVAAQEEEDVKRKLAFCENCQEQFECFDDHMQSKKHRKFACEDKNFRALDLLIFEVRRKPRLSN